MNLWGNTGKGAGVRTLDALVTGEAHAAGLLMSLDIGSRRALGEYIAVVRLSHG